MSHMHRSAVGRLSNEDGACLDESRRFVSRNPAAKGSVFGHAQGFRSGYRCTRVTLTPYINTRTSSISELWDTPSNDFHVLLLYSTILPR